MVDFSKIKTIPLAERKNKFQIKDMIKLDANTDFENKDLEELSKKIIEAKQNNKPVIFMIGAHVIKVGCSDILIDLMKKGFITHIAMNGAGPIHDFEIAYQGATSEWVEDNIKDGTFGMAEETGRLMNEAIKEGASQNIGLGKAIGKKIEKLNLKYKEQSVLYHAYKLNIPVTAHSAIGTEIIHQHPSCDGAAIGKTTYHDFKTLTDTVSKLNGGVLANIGSAVILPEVFLKALAIARNLGFSVKDFTAANLDMLDHYRTNVNILERPTSLGGNKFKIIARHEKTMPKLYQLLTK